VVVAERAPADHLGLARRGRIRLRRERVATRDGDFVDLDWLDDPPGAPLVLVLQGLEGSARSRKRRGGRGRLRSTTAR
jgi:uncharacterized protein